MSECFDLSIKIPDSYLAYRNIKGKTKYKTKENNYGI